MSIVREATKKDVQAIAKMAEPFIGYSDYSEFVKPSLEEVRESIESMIDVGKVFVAVEEEQIVGVMVGMLTHPWLSPSTIVATEMAWWVNENHRGGRTAFRLLKAFEDWAKENRAAVVAMSDLVIKGEAPLGTMLQRLGYTTVERSHVKRI